MEFFQNNSFAIAFDHFFQNVLMSVLQDALETFLQNVSCSHRRNVCKTAMQDVF